MIEIIGAIFIIIIGSLSHFLYDWSNHNKIIGYFTAVNESTWEHIKLIIAPSILWFFVEYHVYFNNPNLFFAKFISLFTMITIIPLIFYTYTYFTKKNILIIDILSFIFAVIIGQILFYIIINVTFTNNIITHIGIIGLLLIIYRYLTKTYVPDKNFIHIDPISKKYGIEGHTEINKKE